MSSNVGFWLFGTLASIASVVSLIQKTFSIGLKPVLADFVEWWRHTLHVPLEWLYEVLPLEWFHITIPPWLHDYHLLSFVGAAIYVRSRPPGREIGGRLTRTLGLLSKPAQAAIDLVSAFTIGLIGLGALFLFSGLVLAIRPGRYRLRYRDLISNKPPDVSGEWHDSVQENYWLFRSSAFTALGVVVVFALNYYAPS